MEINIEEEVDITMDSFEIFLPDESSYADPNALCDELVYNGDAEGNGFNPYPMGASIGHERIQVIEEHGNKFWRLVNRENRYSSIDYTLNVGCLARGVWYRLSAKVRFNAKEGFVGGSDGYYWYILYRKPSHWWIEHRIVHCDAQSIEDGWVTCSGDFIIDEDVSEGAEARLRLAHWSEEAMGYNLDFDDISIRYLEGYVDEIVVDSNDVSCWGNGSDVHITSATYYNNHRDNGSFSQIHNHTDNGDGTTNIQLKEASFIPMISVDENEIDAVEIAILSRNIRVLGDNDEDNKGGYMQVLHTPNVAQVISGIEFINMGRLGEEDRFVSQTPNFCLQILFIWIELTLLFLFRHYNSSIPVM